MSEDVTPLSEQLDPSTPAYVNARLMELEQKFQEAPTVLRVERGRQQAAAEALAVAEAHAGLKAAGDSGLRNESARKAYVTVETAKERAAFHVADAGFKYLQERVRAYSQELDSLRTRATNLRAEINISGQGQR